MESHENAFQKMKEIVGRHEVLVPLNLNPDAPPIRVVSDASLAGIGGYICQGETLETSRPAVYHSRVFTPAQLNYPVHEQELLALEDLIKSYEHWLLSRPFTAVTDSQAILSLLKQKHLSPRQWRSVIYLSKFDITFEFIEGKKNIIVDLLSRIAERSTYKRNLPFVKESDPQVVAIQLCHGKQLLEKPQIKKRSTSSAKPASEVSTAPPVVVDTDSDEESLPSGVIMHDTDIADTSPELGTSETEPENSTESPNTPELSLTTFSIAQYIQPIVDGYKEDTQFIMALNAGIESGVYILKKGLLYTGPEKDRLCIPNIKVRGGRDGGNKNL